MAFSALKKLSERSENTENMFRTNVLDKRMEEWYNISNLILEGRNAQHSAFVGSLFFAKKQLAIGKWKGRKTSKKGVEDGCGGSPSP